MVTLFDLVISTVFEYIILDSDIKTILKNNYIISKEKSFDFLNFMI